MRKSTANTLRIEGSRASSRAGRPHLALHRPFRTPFYSTKSCLESLIGSTKSGHPERGLARCLLETESKDVRNPGQTPLQWQASRCASSNTSRKRALFSCDRPETGHVYAANQGEPSVTAVDNRIHPETRPVIRQSVRSPDHWPCELSYAIASRPIGSNCNWFELRSTPIRTCAPCSISPFRILMAKGSCTMRCKALFSGRAP